MSTKTQIAVVALAHSPLMTQDTERSQAPIFRDGVAQVKSAVEAFNPTLVFIFGPDHERALTEIAPCFTVVESASGFDEWGLREEPYDVSNAHAVALGKHLVAAGIDIAVAPSLGLDHGFGLSMTDLFGSVAAVPVVPILINCIGRPLATASRTATLGAAVGEFIRTEVSDDERVLVVGSGGISHTPPVLPPGFGGLSERERAQLLQDKLAVAAQLINEEWDREFLARIGSEDWAGLAGLTADDLAPAGTGGAEVRNWIAAAFAGGGPLDTVAYEPVPEWITGMGVVASNNLVTRTASVSVARAVG